MGDPFPAGIAAGRVWRKGEGFRPRPPCWRTGGSGDQPGGAAPRTPRDIWGAKKGRS